ncbi:MAG: ATP-dependent zinc metalloprotease FtsH [Ureaplasma sp.]|nr:ATP-dependent zinc metalloprotease FtsH [Ureaplasma sp.]
MYKWVKKIKLFKTTTENSLAKEKPSDKLAQPKNQSNSSSGDGNKNKSIFKRLLWWGLGLGILAAIIAPIVVSCTRQTEITLSNKTTISVSGNNINFTDSTTYTVENNLNSLLSVYYRATQNQYTYYFRTTTNTLPIAIDVSYNALVNAGTTIEEYKIGSTTITRDVGTGVIKIGDQSEVTDTSKLFFNILDNGRNIASTRPQSFDWLGLLVSLVPTIVLIIIFVSIFSMTRRQMSGGMDGLFGTSKTNFKETKTNVHFSDVAGIDEVKEELSELVDYVKNPSKYAAMGARAPRGVILYGPPGTGKTLIAKAVAGEANCAFIPTSGSSFEDMLVGVGAKRVRELFAKARKNAPAIIFIDEIDSVAAKRGKNDFVGGGSGVADQTINQLLAEMDGFSTDSGVIVIAATNRLDVLDEAILRPGRFDRQIQVTLPDIKGREAILKIHAKNKNLSSDVNLHDIARRTPGFSGAQLENVLNEAAILAVRNNKIVIKTSDIDEAIDRVIGGPARHGRVISESEKRQIAYHEGGHALVGLHSENTEVVQKITIIPRGDAAGYTMQTPSEQEKSIQTKEDLLNQVRMTLGGRAAEEVIYGLDKITTGASNDLYKVSRIVKAMVMSLGMSSMGLTQFVPSEGQTSPLQQKMYSEETARELDKEIETIIQSEYTKAKEIIKKHRKELDLIVETLMLLETIVKEQIDYIHNNLELPPEAIEAKKINEKNDKKKSNDSSETDKKDSEPESIDGKTK